MKYEDLVLLKDVDFFGTTIEAGTIYKQVTGDVYHPTINGSQCPVFALSFYTVKNNPNYFIKIKP